MVMTVAFRADSQLGRPGGPGIGLGIGLGKGPGVGDANGAKGVGKIPGRVQTDSCADANAVPSVRGCAGEPPNGPALLPGTA